MPPETENTTAPAPEPAIATTPAPTPAKPPTAAQIAAQKLKEQQAENLAASETYKSIVGKTFTDGKATAEVKEYVPTRLTKHGPRQQFVVNFGNPNCSHFWNCKEFMEQFKTEVAATPESKPTVATTNLPE